jgi:hypothetical protein
MQPVAAHRYLGDISVPTLPPLLPLLLRPTPMEVAF